MKLKRKSPRDIQLNVKMTYAEKIMIEDAAEAEGFESVSAWARTIFRRAAEAKKPVKVEPDKSENARSENFQMRVSPAEEKTLKATAKRHGVKMFSSWMRTVMVTEARRVIQASEK